MLHSAQMFFSSTTPKLEAVAYTYNPCCSRGRRQEDKYRANLDSIPDILSRRTKTREPYQFVFLPPASVRGYLFCYQCKGASRKRETSLWYLYLHLLITRSRNFNIFHTSFKTWIVYLYCLLVFLVFMLSVLICKTHNSL